MIALFSAGLKLDRPLTFRDWSHGQPPAAARDAADDRRRRAAGRRAARAVGRRARSCSAPRWRRPTRCSRATSASGPPGDEDEHEPNFALTAEAGLNDGLAAPFVLAGLFVAEQRRRLGAWSGSPPTSSTRSGSGWRSAPGSGTLAAWSVKRLRSRDLLDRHVRRLPRDRHRARDLRARRAGRRLRLPRRLRGRPRVPPLRARPRDQRDRARGRRADGEAARARGDPAARLHAHRSTGSSARAGRAGCVAASCCSSWCGRWRACCRSSARAWTTRSEKAFVAWFGVRGVGTLYYVALIVGLGRARRAPSRSSSCGRASPPCSSRSSSTASPPGRRCAGCSRCAGASQAATCSSAAESSSLVERSSTAASSAGWWIGSVARLHAWRPRARAPARIVSPASNASNTRGSM